MEISIKDILSATGGEILSGNENLIISGISIDSRKIKEGYLFIPIIGQRFDGHMFIEDAFSLGAVAALTSRDLDIKISEDKTIIKVDDTLKSLQKIAQFLLKKTDIPVVAVTGSTGKTTTKEFISSVLSEKYKILKNEGNFNNHIGLPLTILKLKKEHDIAVLEMGMSNRGEIDVLSKLTKPKIGIITNIGISHIENLGSRKAIFKAKMEIANYMDKNSILIVNGDDDFLGTLKKSEFDFKIFSVGFKKTNDIYVEKIINSNTNEVEFLVCIENKSFNFKIKVPGIHNVYNALFAIAVGVVFKIPIDDIIKGLKKYKGSKMRLNIFKTSKGITVINDCYNASPDSMKAALEILKNIEGKRKIAVLGDMFEMGEYSESAHSEVGKMVVEKNIDLLITVGKESRMIAKTAIEKGLKSERVFTAEKNDTAINLIKDIIKQDDVILVKGSRGMKMEEIVHFLQERS
ncbi:UDP-N-acetylmuramoyl-tripeptide--D-alanyl-D-alanine ligase [Caminicella sporogenes DSM 14501]|uniref:UDP-N-acetylmuramoyl-tripeptide--D-alanyl-D-alanine ligase n=1 Tax=Caminicella sporogenes DSM 14501 TaxID=1121266 RepID=A0A1M6L107_9FIRM|nr:UDP-N-acetylmuramoyl-tripeptide--D-alanyl-D-alanine ligase [Caminicella sporogenes]RKD27668.1 hypothetical protein BET04_00965 [Caminicella sporogenes]SHJ64891.1 UDP-N-acetylmuramoyl-tripeptide--D-alanyl-D-alanine ligase [Caminicella sporogenes DSM 14501]